MIFLDGLFTILLSAEIRLCGSDFLDLERSERYIQDLDPDILINLAAYTQVEKAENDIDNARIINALAIKSFANVFKKRGGYIIQISTDYVFNGKQNFPYKIAHPRDPLSIYGKTKSEGEKFLEDILDNENQFKKVKTLQFQICANK